MEIGSIYEINPAWLDKQDEFLEEESGPLKLQYVERYGKKNTVYTGSGREAIDLAIQSLLEEQPGLSKRVLLPSYMCDSVFIPFLRNGWELFFYSVNRAMQISKEQLQFCIQETRPSLLFIHGYYGMDSFKEWENFLIEQQQAGLLVMEDLTQSYYRKRRTQFTPDYLIGSLRKWYFIPDGGFVTTDHYLNQNLLSDASVFPKERMEMLTDKWNYLQAVSKENWEELQKQKQAYLQKNRELELFLDEKETISVLSDSARKLLLQVEEEKDCTKRKANALFLYREFMKLTGEEFSLIPGTEGSAALYFPVYVRHREEYQSYLQKQDIYAPVLWPVGEENRPFLKEEERYIYAHLLALPMDQRYGEAEMQRLVDVTKQYLERTGNACDRN